MSYPFISLSTVSFTRGMLLGSLISFTLQKERRGVKWLSRERTWAMQKSRRRWELKFTFDSRPKSPWGKKSKSQSGFSWSSPSQQILYIFIYPDVFWMLRGERASNLLQTVQSSQWGGACAEAAWDQSVERDDGGWTVSIADENVKGTTGCT